MTAIGGWRRSALFFAIAFVQALDNQLIPVFLPVIRREMPGAPVGWLLTAYALACATIPFLATMRRNESRLRDLALAALLVLAAAALAFAATTAFPLRLALRAAAGAASGTLSMALLLAAARAGDEASRGRLFTVITAGQLSALVLGPPVATRFDWSATYVVIAGAGVALAFLFRAFPKSPGDAAGAPRPLPWREIIRSRRPALILLATGIAGAVMAGPAGYLSSYLAAERGLSIETIGTVYMWAGVGPLLAMQVGGRGFARRSPLGLAIAGSFAATIPIGLFPTLASSFAAAAALMLACVFIETLRRAALQGALADVVDAAALPRYLACRGVIMQIGLAAGFSLAEAGFIHRGFGFVCAISAVMSIIAALVLLSAARPIGSEAHGS